MAFYDYPSEAAINKTISKTKFYQKATISNKVKQAYINQIQTIQWAYKLSPESTNLAAAENILEIEVFNIQLKTQSLDEEVLLSIDKAIQHPILFQLYYQDLLDEQTKTMMAYKRPSDADPSKWVVEQYVSTDWTKSVEQTSTPLPLALDLSGLYAHLLRGHLSIDVRENESLQEQLLRYNQITKKQMTINKLQRKLKSEKQFNRKVEINTQLQALQQDINVLQQ